ncbi:MAG: chemotaxis protein CheW [Candidatus Methylacidiphilales bacterium]|nr:chemotaxis protein CheW [Candidatus Methylacidiphilales bacterium]
MNDIATTIDWPALRARLMKVSAQLERGHEVTPEERVETLRARARQVALAPPVAQAEATMDVVEFSLLHEMYGLEARFVRAVAKLEAYMPLPGAPAYVLGFAPWRGRMLTVMNLKPFFDLPPQGITNLNKIIVLQDGASEFGLLADAVSGALRVVPESLLQAPLPTMMGVRSAFCRGVTAEGLIVLDARLMLRDTRFGGGRTMR